MRVLVTSLKRRALGAHLFDGKGWLLAVSVSEGKTSGSHWENKETLHNDFLKCQHGRVRYYQILIGNYPHFA